jgi:hypothetical protein
VVRAITDEVPYSFGAAATVMEFFSNRCPVVRWSLPNPPNLIPIQVFVE